MWIGTPRDSARNRGRERKGAKPAKAFRPRPRRREGPNRESQDAPPMQVSPPVLKAEIEARLASVRERGALQPRSGSRRFVALGGGTGLPVVLHGLKETLFPP